MDTVTIYWPPKRRILSDMQTYKIGARSFICDIDRIDFQQNRNTLKSPKLFKAKTPIKMAPNALRRTLGMGHMKRIGEL